MGRLRAGAGQQIGRRVPLDASYLKVVVVYQMGRPKCSANARMSMSSGSRRPIRRRASETDLA